jgi:N-acyl homoserine lactone hydrolase
MLRSMFAVLIAAVAVMSASAAAADPRLYAIDCGRADFSDLGPFSDTGEYDGQPGTAAQGSH